MLSTFTQLALITHRNETGVTLVDLIAFYGMGANTNSIRVSARDQANEMKN